MSEREPVGFAKRVERLMNEEDGMIKKDFKRQMYQEGMVIVYLVIGFMMGAFTMMAAVMTPLGQ